MPLSFIEFPSDGAPLHVATVHWDEGLGLSSDWSKPLSWYWQEMIAQLDAESMKIVVEGEKGKSHGLIGCSIMSRPSSYDHTRAVEGNAVAAENREQTMRVWDFIITRFDGTKIRLHPQRNEASVEAYSAEGPTEQAHLPKMGHATNGPGTFRKYVYTQNQRNLKFDPKKGWGLPPHTKKN